MFSRYFDTWDKSLPMYLKIDISICVDSGTCKKSFV